MERDTQTEREREREREIRERRERGRARIEIDREGGRERWRESVHQKTDKSGFKFSAELDL